VSPTFARLLAWLGLLSPDRLLVPVVRGPLRVDALLFVHRDDGTMEEVFFRVDSGCSHSTFPLARAVSLGLPTTGPRKTIRLVTALGPSSEEVISRVWSFRLSASQSSAPFFLPVHLVVNRPASLTPLLGLTGVIEQLRWTFDGRDQPGAPYGFCLLEDQRPVTRRYPD
jgi:hypothetical protein